MRKVKIGAAIIALLLLFSLAFMGRGQVDSSLRVASPSAFHPFGCDTLGRDLLSRVAFGTVVSFSVSLFSSALGVLFGILLSLMNTRRGILSSISLVLISSFKAMPTTVISLFLISISGGGVFSVITALSISSAVNSARVLSVKIKEIEGEEYIKAEEALGMGRRRIIIHHIVPALFPYIREEWSTSLISGILIESSLSYLGIGIDRAIPTLGSILFEGRALVLTKPHIVIFPALALVALGLGVLLVSRGLSELNPSSH